MAKYRKKPVVIEATQWFKDGGHPAVHMYPTLDPDMVDPAVRCRVGRATAARPRRAAAVVADAGLTRV